MSKRPTDDLEPSAKRGKRGSDRQLTKDDASEDEDNEPVVAGTFARASEDELKDRKIVKARRGPKTTTASANLFAGVNLTTPKPFAGAPLPGATAAASSETQAQSSTPLAGASGAASDAAPASANGASDPSPSSAVTSPPAEAASAAAPGATSAAPALGGFSSFAGSTSSGFALTASSASGFAFGNAAAQSAGSSSAAEADGSAAASAAAPQAGPSIFGSSLPGASFSFGTLPAAGTTGFPSMQSIFGTSSSSADAPHVFGSGSASTKPALELSEADTKNGEEDEVTPFHGDGKLFQFVQQQWRERGSGDMRLKVNSKGQARLVMRQRGNLKLLLNANLFPGMTHSIMDGGKGAMFQAMNYVNAQEAAASPDKQPAAAEPVLTTYAFKSKQPGVVSSFDGCVSQYKAASTADGSN